MSKAYNEILESMKREFFDECGKRVESFSELDARFKSVASELFSLYCRCDFVLRQAFPQTATGEHLDFHAALRDMRRKQASKAEGALTFSISEVSESDTEIPEGCLCSLGTDSTIQYITTESGVIPAGEESVTVSAEAVECGSVYNTEEGTVTVIVNPPLTVEGVTNNVPFENGFDAENDEKLRKRILSSYSVPPTGFSLKSIKEAILSIDEILDCNIYTTNSNNVYVIVNVSGEGLTDEIKEQINGKLYIHSLLGMNAQIRLAQAENYNLKIDVKCNISEYDRISAEVTQCIRKFTDAQLIGENLSLSRIAYSVSGVEGVEYCEIGCTKALDGTIYCPANSYLRLNLLEVECHE